MKKRRMRFFTGTWTIGQTILVLPIRQEILIEVVNEPVEEYHGEDDMPELFDPGNREEVTFDLFASDYEKAMRFKDSLACFPNVDNHFFHAII